MNVAKILLIAASFWSEPGEPAAENAEKERPSANLALPVVEVVDRYPPYGNFCRRQPQECDLSGAGVVTFSDDLLRKLSDVNIAVNAGIRFAFDADQYGSEEYWALPASGYGDCEDLALEKRSRLAASGLPRGALRLAFAFHKKYLNSHCVLTVETSQGTFVLDSFTDRVFRWDQAHYNYEARERVDGLWDRFDQDQWQYEY